MTSRKPELMSVCAAYDTEVRNGRRPGFVDLQIVLRGIKNEPMETHRITNDKALLLAAELVQAVRRSAVSGG